jgi:hypothetical protein
LVLVLQSHSLLLNLLKHRLWIDRTTSHGRSGSGLSVLLTRLIAISASAVWAAATRHTVLTIAARDESLDLFLPPIKGGEDTPVHLGVSVCE